MRDLIVMSTLAVEATTSALPTKSSTSRAQESLAMVPQGTTAANFQGELEQWLELKWLHLGAEIAQ